MVKKTRGRGRGKATKLGNRTTSNASLASYEDTENEGEVAGRPRANTLARKGRVTRRSKLEANTEEEQVEKEAEKKPGSRKRGGASSTEALKERQVGKFFFVNQIGMSGFIPNHKQC